MSLTGRTKRTVAELTADDVDPIVHALLPLVAGLDRDDERTAGVVDAIEGLFLKLKQGSVRTCVAGSLRGPGGGRWPRPVQTLIYLHRPDARPPRTPSHTQRAPSLPGTVLDLQDQRIYPYGLGFKDDAARGAARQRGAEDPPTLDGPGRFMTLANTKALVALVRKHMSLTVRVPVCAVRSATHRRGDAAPCFNLPVV